MLYLRLFLLLILAGTGGAYAQMRFISYDVSDGLSQNSVHCIYQDRDGFLWLGTQDGLNGFDGHDFKTYKHSETDTTTISDQFVLSITEDSAGYLWVGTRNGCARIIDQTKLPNTLEYIDCRDVKTMWQAIKRLSVRGAPAPKP